MKLIIVTDSADPKGRNRDSITHFLHDRGWEVWHWFRDLWLVDYVPNDTSLVKLHRDLLKASNVDHLFIMSGEDPMTFQAQVPEGAVNWLEWVWSVKEEDRDNTSDRLKKPTRRRRSP